MQPLRVLIADDHRLFRQGLIGLMRTRPDLIQVVGEAATGQDTIIQAQSLRPNLILMDIQMPDGDGLQATACLRELLPDTAVVMLTASEANEHVYEAVRLGAAGYLLKSLDAAELFDLLEGVARGEAAMTRAMASRLLKSVASHSDSAHTGSLTEREIDVLRLVARGASNPQIAEELCITVNTVKAHLKNILEKLRLENRTQAAAYAVRCGMFPATEQDHPIG
jgi:two-component system, NarL family, nitrate/nitrite response regulator NarL